MGGGSVLLGVLERYPNLDEVVASDINPNLIQVWFFYMNKMGFRGMYRENQSGEMNIPFGNYKKTPALQPESYWVAMSRCLERVRFEYLDV